MVSSSWSQQHSQVALVVIFLRKRFPLVGTDSARSRYADLVEYKPLFVFLHILVSLDLREHSGMLRMTRASLGRNSPKTQSSIQLLPSSANKAHTLVFAGKLFRGEITLLECKLWLVLQTDSLFREEPNPTFVETLWALKLHDPKALYLATGLGLGESA
nr:hypothetical protein CFP56_17913 [Quercus suber]